MPLDAVRKFFKGQHMRLQNLKPLLLEPEKRLIEQRQQNLLIAQALYIEKQKIIFVADLYREPEPDPGPEHQPFKNAYSEEEAKPQKAFGPRMRP